MGRETQIRVLECGRPEISYYYTCLGEALRGEAILVSFHFCTECNKCSTVFLSVVTAPYFLTL